MPAQKVITPEVHRRIIELYEERVPGTDKRLRTMQDIADILGVAIGTISTYIKHKPAPAGVLKTEAEPSGKDLLFSDNYIYNEKTDTYVTYLKRAPRPVVISGANHRAMLRAYSNWDGQPATINEICRTFGMPRSWFDEYKTLHSWTHDREPFTPEELEVRSEDEMTEEALQMKRQSLYRKFEAQKWSETKSAAEKWWNFEQSVMNPLTQLLGEKLPKYKPPVLKLPKSVCEFSVVLCPFDYHYGKNGWQDEVGQCYSRDIAKAQLLERTAFLLRSVSFYGRPKKFIVAVGSDWFNIDNYQGGTTNGTRQDNDGSIAQIKLEGTEMAVMYIDLLRQIAPVEIRTIPGNHDWVGSLDLGMYLQAWFRNEDDVKVIVSPKERQYMLCGDTLLGFYHGHQVKPAELPSLMAHEASELWGKAKQRAFFTGHFHYEMVKDDKGVTQYQMPSLSGPDRWTYQMGFVTARTALTGYIVEETDGVIANLIAPVRKLITQA